MMHEMTHRMTREMQVFYNEHHEKCSSCGKSFLNGDTAHLGYVENGIPAVLCDGCSKLLEETVVRYYWQKRAYETPNPTDQLWRYMDLSKLISMISKKELYFPAAKYFADSFEGAKGLLDKKAQWDEYYQEFFRNAILSAPGVNLRELTEERVDSDSQRLLDDMHSYGIASRENTFISCWHMSEYESEAMWKLYAKDIENAIAIQTTYQRLYEALDKNPCISIGKIKYIDFSERFVPVNDAFWFKRKSFDYEKEVRAIIQSHNKGRPGIGMPIDLEILIQNIYVSPYAPTWFYDVVKSVLNAYSLNKPVVYSQLGVAPFY